MAQERSSAADSPLTTGQLTAFLLRADCGRSIARAWFLRRGKSTKVQFAFEAHVVAMCTYSTYGGDEFSGQPSPAEYPVAQYQVPRQYLPYEYIQDIVPMTYFARTTQT
ncbi:hypothetical protein IAQ61_011274, partial [Plenodomus lingam]|uniref:Predicted protein n=1 Tax=Leptosphaeria maculans (strain JN3 / isolate v23.1.3 / race Av1-4-5-6-7-8) TaxID=985895 RepID=E5A9K0_LEPMJ